MYNRTWGVWQLILHYLLNCTTAPGVWTAIVVECVIFKHLQTPHSSPEDVQRFVQKGKWLGNLECYTQMCWQLLSSICLLLQLKLTLNHSYESAKLFQDHGSFSPRTVYGNICAMTCTFHNNNAFWPSNCHCNLIECACVCVHVLASFPGLPTVQFLISIFAYFKRSKTGQWEGLRTRLHVFMKCVVLVRVFQSSQCNTVDFCLTSNGEVSMLNGTSKYTFIQAHVCWCAIQTRGEIRFIRVQLCWTTCTLFTWVCTPDRYVNCG